MPSNLQTTTNDAGWSIEQAREFYSIAGWSEGYFDVNELGHVVAKHNENSAIDLIEVSEQIKSRGLSLPVLVRFPQLLQARVKEISAAFRCAADKHDCQVQHIPYYPIKVNQQKTVVEQMLANGEEQIGLEVGSKTELLVALGVLDQPQSCLICNGYKDRAYIRMALYAQNMGINVFIVIESPSELNIIKNESERLGITPQLGIRVKLDSLAEGQWQNSGGKDAKFGLDTKDILYCLKKLKLWNSSQWLQLIHFHMGSQISKLNEYENGLKEAMHIYGEIKAQGFPLNYFDVGGGLAIDYVSQHDAGYFSRAYAIQEYAEMIISTVVAYCQQREITPPIIITENGRALTAHHAMLMTNIVKVRDHEEYIPLLQCPENGCEEINQQGKALLRLIEDNNIKAEQYKKSFEFELQDKFLSGEVSLQQRAWAEYILQCVEAKQQTLENESGHLPSSVIEKYYGNFSVFQSMPDTWGLGQVFPIMPLGRLLERPTKECRVHDLTCDSDGQIKQYAFNDNVSDYLTLHDIAADEEYLLGFFLLGAYQEVLGDVHNLFGDTHALNVEQDDQGQLQFTEIEIGDSVSELLATIHIDGEQIMQNCRNRLEQMQTTNVTSEEMLDDINNVLFGYTYLDSVNRPAHRIKR